MVQEVKVQTDTSLVGILVASFIFIIIFIVLIRGLGYYSFLYSLVYSSILITEAISAEVIDLSLVLNNTHVVMIFDSDYAETLRNNAVASINGENRDDISINIPDIDFSDLYKKKLT